MRKNYVLLFIGLLLFANLAIGQNIKKVLRLSDQKKEFCTDKNDITVSSLSEFTSSTVSKSSIDCPGTSLFSNPMENYTAASNSEAANGFKIATSFRIDGTIDSVTFWGINAYFDGEAWSACNNEDPMIFDLSFYEMDGDSVGEIYQLNTDIEARALPTGVMYSESLQAEIIQYTIVLPNAITALNDGFVSAVAKSDNSCSFLWVSTSTGVGIAYRYSDVDESWVKKDNPYTVCLAGEPNSCLAPIELTSINISTNSADLGWTELGSATNWSVQFSALGGAQVSSTILTAATNPYQVNSLMPGNRYEYQVRSVCSDNDTSIWSTNHAFRTLCEEVTDFPFSEDFDGNWDEWCWKVINADEDEYTWTQANTYITPAHSGEFTAHGMGNQDDYLISPALYLDDKYQFSWWDKVESATYNNTYEILVSTTGTNPEDFTDNLGEFDCYNTDWTEHTVYLSGYQGQTVHIAIHQTYSKKFNYGFGIDDVEITIMPLCPPVTNVVIYNTTQTTAEIGWLENGDATTWNIEYGEAGFTPGEGTLISTTDNPTQISGLTEGTYYDAYIQANCGTETSNWSESIPFATKCNILTDISESFETAVPPICWITFPKESATLSWIQSDAIAQTGTFSAKATYENTGGTNEKWLVTGKVTVPAGRSFSFFTTNQFSTDYGSFLQIKISTGNDSLDTEAYTNLLTLNETDVESGTLTLVSIDVSAYENQDVFLAFVMTDNNGDNWYIDDVAFISCAPPTGLTAENVTETGAVLSWEGTAESFVIEYGESGFNLGEGNPVNVTENTYTLEGLTSSTIYEFYVKAKCSETNESTYTGPFEFNTLTPPCDDITTFPYFAGFEGQNELVCWTTKYNTANDGGLNGNNLIDPPTTNTWAIVTPESFNGTGENYIYEGTRSVGIGYSAPDFNWLISPNIILDDMDHELNFMLWIKDSVEVNWITLFYVNVFDGTNWTTLQTFNENVPSNYFDEEISIDLSPYAGSSIKIAFVFEFNDGYQLAIDNINIESTGSSNDATDIVSYSFNDQIEPAIINSEDHTVDVIVENGTDQTSLVAYFELSEGASIKIDETIQQSGVTINDFTQPVTYTVEAEDGVTSQDWTVTVTVDVGVSDELRKTVKVYPNPAQNILWIEGVFYSKTTIKLRNLLGKEFSHMNISNDKVAINIANLEPGIYFIELSTGNEKAVFKLLKE